MLSWRRLANHIPYAGKAAGDEETHMARFRHKFPVRLLHVIALLGLLPAIESVADSKNGLRWMVL